MQTKTQLLCKMQRKMQIRNVMTQYGWSSGVHSNFVPWGGVQQIQLRTDRTGVWGR